MITAFIVNPPPTGSEGLFLQLVSAVREGNTQIVKLLLEQHEAVEVVNQFTATSSTPLIISVTNNDVEMVKLLCGYGANINSVDGNGFSALSQAVSNNNLEVARFLLEKGVGNISLSTAVSRGNIEMIELLLSYGADINSLSNNGITILSQAIRDNNTEVAKYLLDKGANVNYAARSTGNTALLVGVDNSNIKMVELLLDRGADIEQANLFGETPLVSAIIKCDTGMVKLLLDNNANVNYETRNGCRPIIMAINKGHCAIVEMLLDHANTDFVYYGKSPVEYALMAENNKLDLVRLLITKGNNQSNTMDRLVECVRKNKDFDMYAFSQHVLVVNQELKMLQNKLVFLKTNTKKITLDEQLSIIGEYKIENDDFYELC